MKSNSSVEAQEPPTLTDADRDAIAKRLAELLGVSPTLQLYTQKQVAAALAVSERTIDNLVAAGELIPVRVTPSRKARRFAHTSIEAFIRSRLGKR